MKRYTQSDLRKIFEEPSQDLKERIHQEISSLPIKEQEEKIVKKKVSSATIIIAAVIVLAMATALAAGLGGRVNWLGEVRQESEDAVVPTPMPTAEPQATADADEIDPRFYELLDYSKDRELIVLSTAHKGTWSSRIQKISTMEDFYAMMDTAAPDFPVPAGIPEGYVFDRCYVEFGCLPQGEYILTSQTVHPEGFTESHYTVDPSMDFVIAYNLIFKTEDDADHIFIYAFMNISTNPGEYTFGLSDDQSARVVQVEGMENAIIIDSENSSHLAMRKAMSSSQDDLQFTGPETEPLIETYNEYRIEVTTKLLPESELIGIFVK